MIQIAPSLLAADFARLGEEVRRVEQADWLHIDIMDGVFVPNISMGPQIVAALRDKTALPFDVHLMLLHPLQYIETFRKAGADYISFHIESEDDPGEVLAAIEKSGAKPGLAIKPGTTAEALLPYMDRVAYVTVMTVEPGFGGQKLMPEPLQKIPFLKEKYPHVLFEVDGGVNEETARQAIDAGTDILVAGTAVFRAEDPTAALSALRNC